MYFWYYYLESDYYCGDYEKSMFTYVFAESEEDMLLGMCSLLFGINVSFHSATSDLQNFKYITQNSLANKSLQSLNTSQLNFVKNKTEEMFCKRQKKEELENKQAKMRWGINNVLSINPSLKEEEIKEFLNVSDDDWNLYLEGKRN
jgi:hypothetical protein